MEIIAYVDDDDPQLREYTAPCNRQVHMAVGPRIGTASALKKLMSLCETEYMMIGSDDIEFCTPGWDGHMIKAIPKDGIGLAHAADGWKNACNHPVFHRKMYELTGLFPDGFWHFGPDGYWGRVVEKLGRRFFVNEVSIRHLHFRNGHAEMDETYKESRARGGARTDLENVLHKVDDDVKILKAEIDRLA